MEVLTVQWHRCGLEHTLNSEDCMILSNLILVVDWENYEMFLKAGVVDLIDQDFEKMLLILSVLIRHYEWHELSLEGTA